MCSPCALGKCGALAPRRHTPIYSVVIPRRSRRTCSRFVSEHDFSFQPALSGAEGCRSIRVKRLLSRFRAAGGNHRIARQHTRSPRFKKVNIMRWYHYSAYFFGGAFLANSVSHLVNGVSGRAFQSPFASPPGVGLSSSTVNVLWGLLNLAIAYLAAVPGWELRTAQVSPRAPARGGHLGHVDHACSHLRPVLWRTVSLCDSSASWLMRWPEKNPSFQLKE